MIHFAVHEVGLCT